MNNWVQIAVAIIGGGGWIATIVLAVLNRRWKKQDEKKIDPEMVTAMSEALKVLLVKDIRNMGKCLIAVGEITAEDKQTIDDMYKAYKKLPGANGHCSAVMEVVDEKLPVVPEYTNHKQNF